MANKMNNKMNSYKAMKARKTQVESYDEAMDNGIEAALQSVYDGTISKDAFLEIKNSVIEGAKCQFPIRLMNKIYSAGSQVGKITVRGGNLYMTDVTTEEGFNEFRKALCVLGTGDVHVPYTTIWKKGYNMFTGFNFTNGKRYDYYVVSNEEILALFDKVSQMSYYSMTVEDAKALQADLPPFIRAWQESSIDVSKDKSKVFVKSMLQFMKKVYVYSQETKSKKDTIDFGFKAVKDAKEKGKELPDFVYSSNATKSGVMIDLMGKVTKGLEASAMDILNGDADDKNAAMKSIKFLYSQAHNNVYKPFVGDTSISKELAYFIKGIYNICYASLNEKTKITKDRYELMRNAIYTKAVSLGVDVEDVIRVAIATSMTVVEKTVNKDNKKEEVIITRDADANKFKQYPVANIFPNEYVAIMTDGPAFVEHDPEEVLTMADRIIEDGEEITFENGISEDGMIGLNWNFTGELMEDNGMFIEFIDEFAFEPVDAFLTEYTMKEDADTAQLKCFVNDKNDKKAFDRGQFLNSIHRDITEFEVTGVNNNIVKANSRYTAVVIPTKPMNKGMINVEDVISYEPSNTKAQYFLYIISR